MGFTLEIIAADIQMKYATLNKIMDFFGFGIRIHHTTKSLKSLVIFRHLNAEVLHVISSIYTVVFFTAVQLLGG